MFANESERAVGERAAQRLRAMIDRDGEALADLLHDQLSFVHSTGAVDTKSNTIDMITSRRITYEACDEVDSHVLFSGGDAVVVSGRLNYALRIGDAPMALRVRFTDVWIKSRQNDWRLLSTHNTAVPA